MPDKTSTQYQRTNKAIRRAFMELLRQKNFDKITVQDILDETPVTRGTFYAHFRDKYDIAEQMQSEFFQKIDAIKSELSMVDKAKYPSIINKAMASDLEDVMLLSNIHTETVDIRRILEQSYINTYCLQFSGPNAGAEAEIYAKAMTAFLFVYPKLVNTESNASTYIDQVMIEVFTNILQINTPETKEFLLKQIDKGAKK